MNSSDDEYEAYNLAEFTQEDFANIDADILVKGFVNPKVELKGGPAVAIEIDGFDEDLVTKESREQVSTSTSVKSIVPRRDVRSPFIRHRSWNGILSVSDLVSPAWCEMQFDYGLRQKRFKKLDQRPDSFTSGEGKRIWVEKKVAARNDRTVKRGQSVHKTLEREIRPVEIRVDVNTDEERWALRLVNMLSCVQSLASLGCAREMPVFGVIHDEVIVGVIDELLRKPVLTPKADTSNNAKRSSESSHDTPKSKRIRQTPSPPQLCITPSLVSSSATTETIPNADNRPAIPASHTFRSTIAPQIIFPPYHKFTLYLLDTKTRRTHSLPDDVDTLSSRLQLMLYHRLLSPLIHPHPKKRFDFGTLWARLGLNSSKPFSANFMHQARMLLGSGTNFNCLDGLTRLWWEQMETLDVQEVHETLQLVYRTQPERPHNGMGKGKGKEQPFDIVMSREDLDLARAIEESFGTTGSNSATTRSHQGATDLAEEISFIGSSRTVDSLKDLDVLTAGQVEINCDPEVFIDDPDLIWALHESLLDQPKTETSSHDMGESSGSATPIGAAANMTPTTKPSLEESVILGTKEFILDEQFLDSYLTDILQWWHGERPPRGVEVALSRRCFTCEYMSGCEWREKKAHEASAKLVENYDLEEL